MTRRIRKRSREVMAQEELARTDVAPWLSWALSGVFLALLLAVPLTQHVVELRNARARGEEGWRLPQCHDVFRLLPGPRQLASVRTLAEVKALVPTRKALAEYEHTLERTSVVGNAVRPVLQSALARMGAGNARTFIGREGWLFHGPDVDFLTHPWGQFSAATLQGEERVGFSLPAAEVAPEDVLIHFKRYLESRGIELVVVPIPGKPAIHPDKLSPRYPRDTPQPLRNPGWAAFQRKLEAAGVRVYDPSSLLVEARRTTGRAQYLATDSHWAPAAAEHTAAGLARYIREHLELPAREPVTYTQVTERLTRSGDLVETLGLPEDQTLLAPDAVELHQVLSGPSAARNVPWPTVTSVLSSDVLLLGDSFSLMFSDNVIGWGSSAGFPDHLQLHLGRPVERLVLHGGGPFATRERLRQEREAGKDRLRDKRLVIYQFGMVALFQHTWRIVELAPRDSEPAPSVVGPPLP